MTDLVISSLPHTWILDLDGTIVKHNGHLEQGDLLLAGVEEFWRSIPDHDAILLLSARREEYRSETEDFLNDHGLRFDALIMGLPKGERILLNDQKPGGLQTALAVTVKRDEGLSNFRHSISPEL